MVGSADKLVKKFPTWLQQRLPKDIAIIKISESESRKTNRRYRKKNKPANVLSFRYGPDYGEILLCPPLIRREAKKQGHSYQYQLKWMIIHGMLHLADFHHEKPREASKKFEQIEKRLLAKIT